MNTTDDPSPEDEPVTPPEQAAVASDQPGTPGRVGGMARVAAPVVAALLVGGGVVFAVDHNSGSNASASSASAFGGPAGLGARGGGGVAGEQRIRGTVTAKTSTTVTVKSSSGTSTYAVNATTEIVRDGHAASLSSVQVGDPVLVHVYPSSSGQMLVERLFAGSSATGGPGGFGPPPASAGDGTQSSGSGT